VRRRKNASELLMSVKQRIEAGKEAGAKGDHSAALKTFGAVAADCQQIIRSVPETKEADEARKLKATVEALADQERKQLALAEEEAKAARQLELVERLLKESRLEGIDRSQQARERLEKLIKNYPNTKAADKARDMLQKPLK
jgi:hypothetical protein